MPDFTPRPQPKPVDHWFRVVNEASPAGPAKAKVYIFEAIGGWLGINARDFVEQVGALDVDEIELHLNSPGGLVWDGLAIMNTLRDHRARVTTVVDGLAASAASFVALGGDQVVMSRGSQMMIHDAAAICLGKAADMQAMATMLDKTSDSIAALYARKAGGTVADWRGLMQDETWYTAEEAVQAGLADRLDETADPDHAAENHFDLSVFNYAGRRHAPPAAFAANPDAAAASAMPPASEPGSTTNRKEDDDMSFETLKAGLRERLGITDTALEQDDLLAALDEALAELADPTPTAALPDGVVAIEQGTLDQLRADAAAGREARQEQIADRRARLVTAAINDGRIPPARRDHWLAQMNADEDGATATLNSLAKGTIPLAPIGYTGGVTESSDDDAAYEAIYGKDN